MVLLTKRLMIMVVQAVLLLLLLALSLPGCTAFQISHPPTQHITLTRLSSSNSNSDEDSSFDDLDGIGKLSEIYEIDKNNNNAASTTPNTQPIQPPTRRKFTGASSSQSLFTTNNNEQSSSSSPSSNLQKEREREFNLASNFERTFGIQAILLLASLIGVISVGFSGGITDGSERNFYSEDEVDSIVIEQIERMRTDDATEVLLRQESIRI
ncbi:hypothetical protein ACHAWC_000469 [Mediolabrus comicus]